MRIVARVLACAIACLVAQGCGDDALRSPDAPVTDAPVTDASIDARLLGPGLYGFSLDAGAFPPVGGHPNVLVYMPSRFDPTPPLSVVVFLHGFSNCIENVVRDAGVSCEPDAGTPARAAYALVAQMEASGKNALLVCPELAFDQQTGNPGQLAQDGAFRALLAETLADLAPVLGASVSVDQVRPVAVASHSGGYQAAAAIVSRGGVPVAELYLLDSLYGDTATFDTWVMSDRAALGGAQPARRFADVYTAGGGTLGNSQAMADRASTWVSPDAGILIDDRTTATWPEATYHHGLLFKLSGLSHDGVPLYYFGPLVRTSSLRSRP